MIKTLLWFSEIPWDFLVQRHHHLIENLPSDWKVVFLEPISRYRFRLRHLRQHNLVAVPLPINGLLLEIPLLGRFLRLLNRIYLSLVLRAYGVRNQDAVVVSSNVFVLDLVKRVGARALIYDCHDDVPCFPHLPASTPKFFEQMIQQADLVVCSSNSLHTQTKVRRRNACVYVGNGVADGFITIANDLRASKYRPAPSAVGFIGVLSEWVEFGLLETVAEHFPHHELWIVGPTVRRCRPQVERLKAYPNVRVAGLVPYKSLPFYLARLKVGLIPFKANRLTFSVNPNKLYEYAAFGMEVVSTDFSADVRQYADRVRVARSAREFLEEVRSALQSPSGLNRSIQKIAEENTWEKNADRFNLLLLEIAQRHDSSSSLYQSVAQQALE